PATGAYYLAVKHWNPNVGGCGTAYTVSFDEGVQGGPANTIYLPLILKNSDGTVPPTATPPPTPAATTTPTPTATPTSTNTPTPTGTATPTATPTSTPTPTPAIFGDGSDGDLTVSGTYYTDDTRTAVSATANAGQNTVSVQSTVGFAVGDEVLLIQMQGAGAGNYEFGAVAGVGAGTLILQDNLQHTYTAGGDSKAQVIRTPNYQNVTVQSGGNLTAHAWDGSTGGIIALRVSGTMTVAGGGVVDASGKGFRGATGYLNASGRRGESQFGNWNTQSTGANGLGGGGAAWGNGGSGSGGGGGGHATMGAGGGYAGEDAGSGGEPAGTADLTIIFFGGGGGSGSGANPEVGGSGGNGGGAILLFVRSLSVTGSIQANGAGGGDTNQDVNDAGAGGSGAGGSILIKADNADLGNELVSAIGGPTVLETQGPGENGGAGGDGRIRVEYITGFSGTTDPPASVGPFTP
ncbi:MAG: hypothetical protein ACE5H9_10565, partial [Anaerolineae bacterium]